MHKTQLGSCPWPEKDEKNEKTPGQMHGTRKHVY